MRKRIIDPEFFLDEEISHIDYKTRLLYIGLWTLADSNGILEDNESKIRVQIFPYQRSNISKNLQTLIRLHKLVPYEVDKKKYLLVKNFKKWQKESHPTYTHPTPASKDVPPEQKSWKPPKI